LGVAEDRKRKNGCLNAAVHGKRSKDNKSRGGFGEERVQAIWGGQCLYGKDRVH